MKNKYFPYEWAGRPLSVEIGQLAKQANGACLIRYGESAVFIRLQLQKSRKQLTSSH